MRQRKFGFTLAEVMIVLSIIGILSAVLMPIAFNSGPDKNIMKFKKAHNDFTRVIRDLVSSGEYYLPGDLGMKPDGTKIDGSVNEHFYYFCKTVADSLAIKSADCEVLYGNNAWGIYEDDYYAEKLNDPSYLSYAPGHMDYMCGRTQNASAGYIRTIDDIYIINHSPYSILALNSADFIPGGGLSEEEVKRYFYKLICIDLDEPQKGLKPFGIAFRRDGRLKYGARAQWWLDREINKKETECCPLGNVEYTNSGSSTTMNLCDDGDVICTE